MRSAAKRHQDKERKRSRRRRRIATGKRPRRSDMLEKSAEGAMIFRTFLFDPIMKNSRPREKAYNKERAERRKRQGRGVTEDMVTRAAKAMGIELP